MTINADVVEDSRAPNGKRLITYALKYPRFIHAEALTHRDKSRSASSTRAIPVKKMIANTIADPAFFVHVGKNQKGMQAATEVSDEIKAKFQAEWIELMKTVAAYVDRWSRPEEDGGYDIHKQVANRALEPWQHIVVVCSGTEWANMDSLRAHPDAQPEFQVLQRAIIKARNLSTPRLLVADKSTADGWHLPYITDDERRVFRFDPEYLAKLSTARCARVSYLTHDGRVPNANEDNDLFTRLVGSVPLHASPTEHPAYALETAARDKNYVGFRQFRADVEATFFTPQP
jgi:thymidylate synthase ThyX